MSKPRYSTEFIDQLGRDYERLHCYREVDRKHKLPYGTTIQLLNWQLRQLGTRYRPRKHGYTAEEMAMMITHYTENLWSLYDLASEFGGTTMTVRSALTRAGVRLRTTSEAMEILKARRKEMKARPQGRGYPE